MVINDNYVIFHFWRFLQYFSILLLVLSSFQWHSRQMSDSKDDLLLTAAIPDVEHAEH